MRYDTITCMPLESGVEQDIDFISSTAGLYDTPRYRVRVSGEDYDRLQIGSDGTIYTGDGTATPTALVAPGATAVSKSLYDANTILYATTDDTPVALTVGASTVVGRRASGAIVAISYANLLSDLGAAPLASPTFTGNPAAPTQTAADNSTKIATTAYADALVADAINNGTVGIAPSQNAVFDALALKAPLASPTFTGILAGATGAFTAGLALNSNTASAAGGITWGTSGDVSLYRSTAGALSFHAEGSSNPLTLYMIPKGAQNSSINLFGTDFVADATNYEFVQLAAITGGEATLGTFAGGTGTRRGLKIDTLRLGLYTATPVARATTGGAASTFAANTSLIADDTATFDGYTIGQVVKALRNIGVLT